MARAVSRPVVFVGSSHKDLLGFPAEVQDMVGYALFQAQLGKRPPEAEMLHGFGGGSVLEIVDDFDGNAYRADYTTRFQDTVYVPYCFEKKSKRGSATPKPDMDLIRSRLMTAERMHQSGLKEENV